MKHRYFYIIIALLAALALITGAAGADYAGEPSGNGVQPVQFPGNRTCASFDGWMELKVDPAASGTFTDGYLTVKVNVYTDTKGQMFDWEADALVKAVFVKGGPDGNLYSYGTGAKADTKLHAPVNSKNDKYYGLSHISFCYKPGLKVEKTAETYYTREYKWDITKEKDGEYWKFIGDPATVHPYQVAVKQTIEEYDFWVKGKIKITNPTKYDVPFGVGDWVDGELADVDCPTWTVPMWGEVVCTYEIELKEKKDGTNVVEVASAVPWVDGGKAKADYKFGEPTKIVGYPKVEVTDTNWKESKWAEESAYWDYTKEFVCPTDLSLYTDGYYYFEHKNTAKIVETGQEDYALVKVHCYAPVLWKDAHPYLTRTWTWDIDKWGSTSELWLEVGEKGAVDYWVKVWASAKDSDYGVKGTIKIYNPHPTEVMKITALEDVVSGATEELAKLDCDLPLYVDPESYASCDYDAKLLSPQYDLNTATATFNGLYFTTTAKVDFEKANVKFVDQCVDVTDSKYGYLGKVCAEKWEFEHTFQYTLPIGPYDKCGEYEFKNCAEFVTNTTGTTGKDCWTVKIIIPCEEGCTPGYWKNHPEAWKGYAPNNLISSVFVEADIYGLGGYTLMEGLDFGGGDTIEAKAQILLRSAIAAVLNAEHYGVSYPWSTSKIISEVNAALKSGDAKIMEALKNQLDYMNNLGCPL